MTKDELNSQAYDDVLDGLSPSMPYDAMYMQCYRFWAGVAGESHFDKYYDARHDEAFYY